MKNNKINLPRIGEDGEFYISISQVSSFNSSNPQYFNQYILGYLFGIRDEGNAYSWQGNATGEYLENDSKKDNPILNDSDKNILDEIIKTFQKLEGREYEKLITIQKEGYKIIGYIDLYYKKDGKADIIDFKSCNIEKKRDEFINKEKDLSGYMQLNLYSYAIEQTGEEIGNVGIYAIDRIGNAFNGEELHLSGKAEVIPVPYDKELTEKFLDYVDNTVYAISSLKTTYDSLVQLTITV